MELTASNRYRLRRVLKNFNVCMHHNYRMSELCLVCKKTKWNNRQFKSLTKMINFLVMSLEFKCSSIKSFPHFSIWLRYIKYMCMLVIVPVPRGSYMVCHFRWYRFSPYGKMFCITPLAAYKQCLNFIFHCCFFKPFRLSSVLFHMSNIKRIVFWFEKLLSPYIWRIMHGIQQATDTNEYDDISNKKIASFEREG